MSPILHFAVVGLVFLASGLAQADQGAGAPAGAEPAAEPAAAVVACEVSGYDIFIRNIGDEPLAVGTEVAWSVPFARMADVYRLGRVLEPGAFVFLTGALGSSFLESTRPCHASLAE